ncbi:hypothetical protein C0J52_25714 [Blattella germanica]|nr:hypothetical protein C0J52_25714 [Blattella germanica]
MPSVAMLTRRNWVLRLSIILNIAVLLYVGTHIASKNGGVDFIEELQASGRNLATIDINQISMESASSGSSGGNPSPAKLIVVESLDRSATATSQVNAEDKESPSVVPASDVISSSVVISTKKPTKSPVSSEQSVVMDLRDQRSSQLQVPEPSVNENGTLNKLEDVVKCHDKSMVPRIAQRSDFWVLYNYIPASRKFRCHETITYTTHADYTFLDNLVPLLDRWRGPVSLAIHAPGTDFAPTMEAIRYVRDCTSPLISEYVTFHIFFGTRHVPKQVPFSSAVLAESANCSLPAPWINVTAAQLYKTRAKILYPVNIGRNIARESAVTHFILPSDIELYPSPGLIDNFLEMIRRQDPPLLHRNPKVFPLPIFELEKGVELPNNKTQLVNMLKNGTAIPFHKKLCPGCHNIPKSKEWMAAKETVGLHVFHIGKRTGYFVHWEPIFIGTHEDPLYDERLSWEGKSDKMTQGYALCVLDYEFQILDNAFLVHKPGIKTMKKDPQRAMLAGKTNALIRKVIFPELKVLYGTKKGCAV